MSARRRERDFIEGEEGTRLSERGRTSIESRRRLLPSRQLLSVLLFLFLFPISAGAGMGEAIPKVVLERVVDGRGNRVCDIAKAFVKRENVRRSAWVVRGLFRDDLVLRREVRKDANVGESTFDEIRLADRPSLRFEGGTPGSRVTAISPASTFRYFDVDVSRPTVRCNLSRLVEETDHELLGVAADYWVLKQGLGEKASIEELPVLMLLAIERRPPHPSPPTRKKNPLPDDTPEASALRDAALAALGEE